MSDCFLLADLMKLCEGITTSTAEIEPVQVRTPLDVETLIKTSATMYGQDTLEEVKAGALGLVSNIELLFEYVFFTRC